VTAPRPDDAKARASRLPRAVAEGIEPHALEWAIAAATDLLREMPEGSAGGCVLTVGDSDAVIRITRQALIDAVKGYPEEECLLRTASMRAILRDRALARGLLVVRGDGTLVSTGREAHPIAGLVPPFDAGDPESVAAAVTRATKAAAVTASRASRRVALFALGEAVPIAR
jgi:hypothetical protein